MDCIKLHFFEHLSILIFEDAAAHRPPRGDAVDAPISATPRLFARTLAIQGLSPYDRASPG